MYTVTNFKTKKELKNAVNLHKYGSGPAIKYFQPGPFGGNEPKDGSFCLEGPHYPEPHKWYAVATAKDSKIVAIK